MTKKQTKFPVGTQPEGPLRQRGPHEEVRSQVGKSLPFISIVLSRRRCLPSVGRKGRGWGRGGVDTKSNRPPPPVRMLGSLIVLFGNGNTLEPFSSQKEVFQGVSTIYLPRESSKG